jgi:hypothetical protein
MNKQATNVLHELHTAFAQLPELLREQVCEECNYSTPHYYRKMRCIDKSVDEKLIPAFTKMEKRKIREIAARITKELLVTILGAEK